MAYPIRFLLLFAFAALFACSKDEDPAATVAPTVEIQSPAEGATVSGPVTIRVAVTGERTRTVQVFVRHAETDVLLFAEAPAVDNPTNFLYTKTVTLNLTTATPLVLNVIAEGENGGRANKSLSFNYAP